MMAYAAFAAIAGTLPAGYASFRVRDVCVGAAIA